MISSGRAQRLLALLAGLIVCIAWMGCSSRVHAGQHTEQPVSRSQRELHEPTPMKDWSILFYNAADFEGYNPLEDVARRMQATDNVSILMLEDTYEAGATVWSLEGDQDSPQIVALADWDEIDMGDASVMIRFLAYAAEYYPAKRTMVMMYQHGGGWRGACYDAHPTGEDTEAEITFLTPKEMQTAFNTVGGIDALLFTAPCVMGAIEPVYQLRDSTDVYVGSEPVSGFIFWFNALSSIVNLLGTQPEIPAAELAARVIEFVRETYSPTYWTSMTGSQVPRSPTLTAVHTSTALQDLAVALDTFSIALIDALESSLDAILDARAATQEFAFRELIDIYDFAHQCRDVPGLYEPGKLLMEAVRQAVSAKVTNIYAYPGAHGLSLYFPLPPDPSHELFREAIAVSGYARDGERYRNSGLELVENTHWDEFLQALHDALLSIAD